MTLVHTDNRDESAPKSLAAEHSLRPWLVISVLFAFMVVNYADRTALGLAGSSISAQFNLTPTQFGLVGSCFSLAFCLSGLVLGFLINRVSSRWLLFVLALVWSLAQLPLLAFASFGVLLATRMLLGVGEGPASSAAFHAAFKWFPNERRTLPVSILTQGSAVGGVLAAPILGWLIFKYGWQSAFGFLAIVGALVAVLWLLVGADGPIATTVTSAGATLRRVPYRRLLINPMVLAVWFALFAGNWAIAMVIFWFPKFLREGLSIPADQIGLYSALPWALAAIVMVASGIGSQRLLLNGFSSRFARVIFICAIGCLGGLCLLAALFVSEPGVKIALVVVGVVLPNAFVAAGQALLGEISPVGQRGAVLSISNAVAGTAGMLAPVVSGWLIQQSGANLLQGYGAAFALCGLVILLANVVGLIFIKPGEQASRFAAVQQAN